MKKLLALILTILLAITCLASCDIEEMFGKKSGVDKQIYENCAVFTFDFFEGSYTVELERSVLGEGAIYYHVNLEYGYLTVNYKDTGYLYEEQTLVVLNADDKMPINGSGGYIEGDKIEISFGTLSPVKGEIIIAFTEDALKAVHKELHLHTHTYSYTSAGKVGHYITSTCGCPSEEGTSPHYDGDTDYFCDFCKCDMTEFADEWQRDETYHWYLSDDGEVYCYGEHENWDADLLCDVCGYNMPEQPAPTNYFLRNQAGCEWMNEITAEDIAEIKITEAAVGVAPGAIKNITSSTDRSVIADIFEKYYWMDTAPIADVYGEIDGGGAVTVDFVLKNGEVKELHFNNGNYRDANGAWFEPLYIPKFSYGTDFIGCYGFVTYTGKGTIGQLLGGSNLGVEPLWLCEFPMDEIEFCEVEIDWGETEPVPTHIVESEFGALMFIDNSIFYINGESGYYYLVGKNLDQLIEEYSCVAE